MKKMPKFILDLLIKHTELNGMNKPFSLDHI